MKILLATENQGKLAEFQALFADTPHTLISMADFDVQQAEENGLTFVENALLKARNGSLATGLPCLADDSGLAVAALNGAPGIYSARFAEGQASANISQDAANNTKLLQMMANKDDRRAHFYCALVLLRHPDDPAPLVATGQWHGNVGVAPEGNNGFGYDPLFIESESGRSAASLPPETKRQRSHRGLAWKNLEPTLAEL